MCCLRRLSIGYIINKALQNNTYHCNLDKQSRGECCIGYTLVLEVVEHSINLVLIKPFLSTTDSIDLCTTLKPLLISL